MHQPGEREWFRAGGREKTTRKCDEKRKTRRSRPPRPSKKYFRGIHSSTRNPSRDLPTGGWSGQVLIIDYHRWSGLESRGYPTLKNLRFHRPVIGLLSSASCHRPWLMDATPSIALDEKKTEKRRVIKARFIIRPIPYRVTGKVRPHQNR